MLAVVPFEAEAIRSRGLDGDPEVCEFPVAGSAAPPLAVNKPPADKELLNVPAAACRLPLKFPVVPLKPPVRVPPARGRKVLLA